MVRTRAERWPKTLSIGNLGRGIPKGSQKGSEEVCMGLGSHHRTSSPFATSGPLLVAVEEDDSIPQVPGGLAAMIIIYSANDTEVGVCSDKNRDKG